MGKVAKALATFKGDLKGSFYPLEGMENSTRTKLVKSQFLPKELDRYQKAAGLHRDWPSGRGVFHNPQKTLMVWVNDEDQVRIFSLQQG